MGKSESEEEQPIGYLLTVGTKGRVVLPQALRRYKYVRLTETAPGVWELRPMQVEIKPVTDPVPGEAI